MRTAITLGRKPGSDKWTLIYGPEVPFPEQAVAVRELLNSHENDEWEAVHLWESDSGITKRSRFTPKEVDKEEKPNKKK